jgi:hypothetical protein
MGRKRRSRLLARMPRHRSTLAQDVSQPYTLMFVWDGLIRALLLKPKQFSSSIHVSRLLGKPRALPLVCNGGNAPSRKRRVTASARMISFAW